MIGCATSVHLRLSRNFLVFLAGLSPLENNRGVKVGRNNIVKAHKSRIKIGFASVAQG